MDLAVVCMQQNGTAFSAGIINRMIARFENRRSVDNRTASYRGGNDLQTDSAIRRHGCSLELTGGSTTELSATDAWHMAVVGDSDSLHPSTSGVCIELLTRVATPTAPSFSACSARWSQWTATRIGLKFRSCASSFRSSSSQPQASVGSPRSCRAFASGQLP